MDKLKIKKAIVIDAASLFQRDDLINIYERITYGPFDALCDEYELSRLSELQIADILETNMLLNSAFHEDEILEVFGVSEDDATSFIRNGLATWFDARNKAIEDSNIYPEDGTIESLVLGELSAALAQAKRIKTHNVMLYFANSSSFLTGDAGKNKRILSTVYRDDDECFLPDGYHIYTAQIEFSKEGTVSFFEDGPHHDCKACDVLFVTADECLIERVHANGAKSLKLETSMPDISNMSAEDAEDFYEEGYQEALASKLVGALKQFLYGPTGTPLEPEGLPKAFQGEVGPKNDGAELGDKAGVVQFPKGGEPKPKT